MILARTQSLVRIVTIIAFLPIAPLSTFTGISHDMTPRASLQSASGQADLSTLVAERGKGETGALIQGDRKVVGVVRKVVGEQIEVDTSEVQPRFLALKEAKEKGFSLKPGDKVEMTLNDQNLVVDYHPYHQPQAHQKVKGRISQPLVVGHERAVIRTENGEQTFAIRPLARSKVASIPVGAPAIFLIDETNQVVDVTFESEDAAGKSASAQKSPPKGAHTRVEGTIVEPLQSNRIRIKTARGEEQPYEVRPMVGKKLAGMTRGQLVILMLDNDGAVIDVAIPPQPKG